MKKFIRSILIFLFALVVFDVFVGIAMDYFKCNAKGGLTRNDYVGFYETNQDVLLFGSSRCSHHYNPDIIEDTLGLTCQNLGHDGLGIIYHYAKLSSIMQYHRPKIVVYDVIANFDLKDEGGYDKYIAPFRPYYGLGKTVELIKDIAPMEHYKNYSSMYKYNRVFIQMLADNVHPRFSIEGNGFFPKNDTMKIIPKKARNVSKDASISIDEKKIQYLRKFIVLCKENDARLVFTLSPWYNVTSSSVYEPIMQLCLEEGIPFLDYYCDKTIAYNKDYFADSSHLNSVGANYFSQKFAFDLKSIIATR